MSVIKLEKLSELRISHLTKAIEEAGQDTEIFIEFDCVGGRPNIGAALMKHDIKGSLVYHDTAHQLWSFSKKMIIKGLEEHKKYRAKALKEMNNA